MSPFLMNAEKAAMFATVPEITLKSTFHHTPRFIREALETIARGEIRATDFITGEVPLADLPNVFEHMKHRNGELKTAVIP